MNLPLVTRRTALKALGAAALLPWLSDEGLAEFAAVQARKAAPRLKVLTAAQYKTVEALVEAMRAETRPLGEEVIAAEAALDRLFATARATPAAVTEASGASGAARGALRAAHLRYHLQAREALTPEQIGRYEELRGYTAGR